jgi:hypothetical protein
MKLQRGHLLSTTMTRMTLMQQTLSGILQPSTAASSRRTCGLRLHLQQQAVAQTANSNRAHAAHAPPPTLSGRYVPLLAMTMTRRMMETGMMLP